MTYLNFEGVFVILGIISVYTLYFVLKILFSNPGSVRNQQTTHQWFLIVGGMLFGVGIGSQVRIPMNDKYSRPTDRNFANSELVFGIMICILGLVLMVLGSTYLRMALWRPLEQISEYSSEFGNSFLGTKLPLIGGKELIRFSERFNENITSLANKISTINIYVNNLERATKEAIQASGSFGNYSDSIENLVRNYQRLVERQNNSLREIDNQFKTFITWYDDTQERLEKQFTEIRGLADVGNMLSVNASIEAINMDVENPGIETVASKLHDLATSLDDRQDDLRKLIIEVRQNYEQFNKDVTEELNSVHGIVDDSSSLIFSIQDTIEKLKTNESNVKSTTSLLADKIDDLIKNLPRAY